MTANNPPLRFSDMMFRQSRTPSLRRHAKILAVLYTSSESGTSAIVVCNIKALAPPPGCNHRSGSKK